MKNVKYRVSVTFETKPTSMGWSLSASISSISLVLTGEDGTAADAVFEATNYVRGLFPDSNVESVNVYKA